MGNHRKARIVGLIQIHVASLEPVWLSMLHNRVSILKWHLFILSISLLRVIGPYQFLSTPPVIYAHHQGHSTFFCWYRCSGWIAEMAGALVFRGGYPGGVLQYQMDTGVRLTLPKDWGIQWKHNLKKWPLEKHIILLSKCTSQLAGKIIHIKLVSSVLLWKSLL